MQVSAETYIVISLMFAVFAAVAAVGTSVVLGAGFERLRLGFEIVKKQTGFFADAIYKLDQKTQELDADTARLKAGVYGMNDRMERVEKQTTFIADAVNSMEGRILQGLPSQPVVKESHEERPRVSAQRIEVTQEWEKPQRAMSDDRPMEMRPTPQTHDDMPMDDMMEDHDSAGGLSTLLSRYFLGGNDKGVVYH